LTKGHDVHTKPNVKIEKTQLGLRALTTSLDTRNKSIREEIAAIKKDHHEEIMIQRTQVEIETASSERNYQKSKPGLNAVLEEIMEPA
jgi:hypothetical protein